MSDKINLTNVTTDNSEPVVKIELGAGQGDLMASNFIRLPPQSDPNMLPRAVYAIGKSSAF